MINVSTLSTTEYLAYDTTVAHDTKVGIFHNNKLVHVCVTRI